MYEILAAAIAKSPGDRWDLPGLARALQEQQHARGYPVTELVVTLTTPATLTGDTEPDRTRVHDTKPTVLRAGAEGPNVGASPPPAGAPAALPPEASNPASGHAPQLSDDSNWPDSVALAARSESENSRPALEEPRSPDEGITVRRPRASTDRDAGRDPDHPCSPDNTRRTPGRRRRPIVLVGLPVVILLAGASIFLVSRTQPESNARATSRTEASKAAANLATRTASWNSPHHIDTTVLISVSCPTNGFCLAVDNNGDALTYQDGTWSQPHNIGNI